MKKIRVLQFPIANSKGGITQYILQNWRFIDKTRFQFDFATMSKTLDFADDLRAEGCKIYYISCYAEDNQDKFINEFKKIITEGDYDIVHLHTKQWKSFIVEEIAKEAGVKKIIIHAHSSGIDTLDDAKRKKQLELHNQILQRLTESMATDFWTCSWKASEFIFGDKISKDKIRMMRNAIDLAKYVYDIEIRKKYRKEFGLSDDEFLVGNVGRLVYQKNQEFLLKVFLEIKNTSYDSNKYKLLLVGSGERIEEYKKIVYDYGLSENVIFAGYRKDVPELLQTMDVFCLPSRFEGLPIGAIEAQAAGLPCVISDCIAAETIESDGVVRLPFDVKAWKEAIFCMCKNFKRIDSAEKLKKAGYDINKQIKIIEEEYIRGIYF